MSLRTILIVLLAVVFGVSAAVGINVAVNRGQARPRAETVPVVVAVQDIASFTKLSEEMLTTREYPKGLIPPGTFTKIEEVKDRVTLARLVKDEPVLQGKLSEQGAGPGIAPIIPPGMRAVTIRVRDEAAGVAGLLEPGNKVDILLTLRGSQLLGTGTSTLLQRITLLAVGQKLEPSTGPAGDTQMFRSVTVLVTPEEGTKLELAQNVGQLYLVLRNPLDQEDAPATARSEDLPFYQGKPHGDSWLKQVEKIADKVTKAIADAGEKMEEEKKKKPPEPSRPERPPILTIRGLQVSSVSPRGN